MKLIVPDPDPKAIVGVWIIPAVSFVPRLPMFRVPVEPACAAIVMPPEAATRAPSATVKDPLPAYPIESVPMLLNVDEFPPEPVTRIELLEEVAV